MISEGQYGDFISVNYFNRSDNSDHQATHTSHEDNSLYYQLFIEALLSTCDEDATSSMNLYLDYCKEKYVHGNEQLLARIKDFVTSYESEHAIWWYTKEPFVYNLLNHALRLQDFDALIIMCFLVRDVHTYLNKHRYPLSIGQPILHFYRGQAISRKEFGKIHDNIGEIIAINSFLSTSKERDVAIFFAASSNRFDEHLQPILFDIIVDPNQTLHPKAFADISMISSMNEAEVEILFSMGSLFRIVDVIALNVESCGELWSVQLQLCDDRLDQVWLSMKSKIQSDESFCQIGQVLSYIGEKERARRLYLYVLGDLFPKAASAKPIDNHPIEMWYVGSLFHATGQNEKALPFLDKALESQLKESDENSDQYYLQLYDIYIERGDVLQKLDRTDSALHDYECALSIAGKKFGDEDYNSLIAWVRIGKCYKKIKKYSEALHAYNTCLGIAEKVLSAMHPERASLHSSIGGLHVDYEEYQQALTHFEKCLEIKLSIGPSNRSLAETYYNIGFTQCALKDFTIGLENLKRAFEMFQKCFDDPSKEPTVIRVQNAIILAQELLRLQIYKEQVLTEMLDYLDVGSDSDTDDEEKTVNSETNVTVN
ncbi:unnamed protein product [Rotaria sp. Silwood2]|nr:unnamed protein product [Rotaria sp. Silwood2]